MCPVSSPSVTVGASGACVKKSPVSISLVTGGASYAAECQEYPWWCCSYVCIQQALDYWGILLHQPTNHGERKDKVHHTR